MNDGRVVVEGDEDFPVPAELLANPALRHRYYDEAGNLLPVEELRRIEEVWREAQTSLGGKTSYHRRIHKDPGF